MGVDITWYAMPPKKDVTLPMAQFCTLIDQAINMENRQHPQFPCNISVYSTPLWQDVAVTKPHVPPETIDLPRIDWTDFMFTSKNRHYPTRSPRGPVIWYNGMEVPRVLDALTQTPYGQETVLVEIFAHRTFYAFPEVRSIRFRNSYEGNTDTIMRANHVCLVSTHTNQPRPPDPNDDPIVALLKPYYGKPLRFAVTWT